MALGCEVPAWRTLKSSVRVQGPMGLLAPGTAFRGARGGLISQVLKPKNTWTVEASACSPRLQIPAQQAQGLRFVGWRQPAAGQLFILHSYP